MLHLVLHTLNLNYYLCSSFVSDKSLCISCQLAHFKTKINFFVHEWGNTRTKKPGIRFVFFLFSILSLFTSQFCLKNKMYIEKVVHWDICRQRGLYSKWLTIIQNRIKVEAQKREDNGICVIIVWIGFSFVSRIENANVISPGPNP